MNLIRSLLPGFRENKPFNQLNGELSASTKYAIRTLIDADAQKISCNEVHTILGEFHKAAERNEKILVFMPLIRQHLEKCPVCREKYETLLIRLQPS
ncbi:MAG: hypothetical protein P8Y68_03210 [Anaerolineales bacterium]|jgi:hypothetical protein